MKKIKDELLKVKSWLIIVTYAVILFLIAFHFTDILVALKMMARYLNPLFYGLIMAFILNIPMVKFEKFINDKCKKIKLIHKFKRGISISLSLILVLSLISLLLLIIVPEITNSLFRLISNLSNYFNSMIMNIDQILSYLHIDIESLTSLNLETFLGQFGIDYGSLIQTASSLILGTSSDAIGQIGNIGNFLFELFMGLMISLYLLGSKEKFIKQFKNIIKAFLAKDIATYTLRVLEVSNDIFKDFVGGKLVEVVVIGVMVYCSMLVFKVPFAILIACLCAAFTIVPVFGPLVATIIACLLLLSVDPVQSLIFFIIYQVVQNIEANLIYPKIVGKSLGLPAVWVLVSIFFFGGLFGPIGMILAVPLMACIYTFGGEFVHYLLKKKEIEETL